jgi:hypothetical protein
MDEFWDIEHCAAALGVSTRTIDTYLKSWEPGGVHYFRLSNRQLRFIPSMVKHWAMTNIDDPQQHKLVVEDRKNFIRKPRQFSRSGSEAKK